MCEVIIEGTKIQPPKGLLTSAEFKGVIQDDVSIAKYMVKFQRIEAEDKTRIEMKRVKMVVSRCKKSVEKLLELNFNEWRWKRSDLKNEIDNLKKANDERVKKTEKLRSENK